MVLNKITLQKNLNALFILTICGVLLAAYSHQIFQGEEPCPLCLLQRLGMIGIASSLFLNLRFGIRPSHYGLGILSAIGGGYVSLRQIALHVCPGFPTFGLPVFGLSLYTWAFIVFVCSVFAIGVLLLLYDISAHQEKAGKINRLGLLAGWTLLLVTAANFVTTLIQCGFSVCHE